MLISMSYGFTIAIFGGFAAYVATWLINVTGSPMAPFIYLIGASAVTLPVLFFSRETAHGRPR
jgi:MHS family proline/betaine transporter-like MFS transporter